MTSINYISQGETTSKDSELEQGENDMNTDLNNSNPDQEEKMYDNSSKTDERNEGMKEKEENNPETLNKTMIDEAIMAVCECINTDNEALKRTEETGINLFISLCKQTTKIEQSEQAKKLLKKRTDDYLKEKIIGTGRGKKPAYDKVFLQLFYMSFAHLDIDIMTNAFSQKKSTYYKAYNYCKDKYKDYFDNFEKLKNRLEEDGIKSVRSLADKFIRPDKGTGATGFKSYKDDDKMFSISKKVFEDITENQKDYKKEVEYGEFLITISVSKVPENSLQEAS